MMAFMKMLHVPALIVLTASALLVCALLLRGRTADAGDTSGATPMGKPKIDSTLPPKLETATFALG
ncbi:MAG TPA: hypothetical protein VEK08_24070 [Planctomycetota bacterium]|nr:hypothetical protein [Planctomycetota bacterium]